MTMQARYRSILKDQNGAVAATYALALFGLLGITGLAFDYARMVSMDTELQNAADQAALAGATQLDRSAGSMERAIAAIQGGLVTNSTLISNDGSGRTIAVTNATQVVFYSSRLDAEAGSNPILATETNRFGEAGFVQVTVDTRDVNYALTPIVGAFRGRLSASAVAGMGSALCRIPPLMICNPDESPSGNKNADFDAENRRGFGIRVVRGEAGKSFWVPGNFGYLDLGNGVPGLREGLGWITPDDKCLSISGADQLEVDTETGVKTDATDSLNTRFDIYDNVACPDGGQCPASLNSRKDLVHDLDSTGGVSGANSCRIHNNGWREPTNRYLPSSLTPLNPAVDAMPDSMGHPRDICHAVSSGGSCTNGPIGNGIWDRDAYFYTHYVRSDGTRWNNAAWTAAVQTGVTKDSDEKNPRITNPATATRYEVYRWEMANAGSVIDGVEILGPQPSATANAIGANIGRPICSQKQVPAYSSNFVSPDRRKVSVAVINCVGEEVNGNSDNVPVKTWIDVFLVQPSVNRDRTKRSEIYAEIIGKTNISTTGSGGGAIVRRDVPFLVR